MHAFASSQLTVTPWHRPAAQVSWPVQAELSLQGRVLLTCVQPLAGSQLSSVQVLASAQSMVVPVQAPARQISAFVQAFLSSHAKALSVCVQPRARSQPSLVQAFASSQSRVVPVQAPARQASAPVQALPSLQGDASGRAVCTQAPSTQLSPVQGFSSVHVAGQGITTASVVSAS